MATNNNIPQGYVPVKTMKEVEQNFERGGFGTAQNFIDNNFIKDTGNQLASIPVTPSKQNQLKSISFQYLNDSGDGRIGTGVLSLEAITKVLKGVPVHSLTLFDQIIYTDPSVFFTNNQSELQQAVYANLGMVEFIPSASAISPQSVTTLNRLVDSMIKDIKNMTFTYDLYIQSSLIICKGVVQAAIKFNGV